ncbi:MAG: thioredoxin family protein [Bradymonadales bacterium]|nr:thioredoxin family protein [Bradymonadales bacterium]
MSWIAIGLCVAGMVLSVALGGLYRSRWDPTVWTRVRRSLGVAGLGISVWLLISLLSYHPPGPELSCHDDLDAAIADGQARQVPVFLDFTAEWCHACHELERRALNTPQVISRADEFACGIVDLTDQDDPRTEELSRRFGVVGGPPAIVFLDPNGEPMPSHTIREVVDAKEFLTRFEAARAGGAGGYPSPFEEARRKWGFLITFGLVFLAGILTSLTPCVYPLIPITISIFGARQAATKREGFTLSLVYVGGIVVTYVTLGVVAAAVGGFVGRAFQNPAVLIAIGALFVILGFSNVGLFELRLPGGLQDRLSGKGGKGYAGALVMGLVAGIIAAPCVGPWLAGILVFIADTGNILLGTLYMAAFALGMGQLFLLLGTFTSLITRIPKSGGWMDRLKVIFGTIFVVVGLYFLAMVLPVMKSLVAGMANSL